jgi:hypothetical protein
MLAPADKIFAPAFPKELTWVNSAPLRMDQQKGRVVLIEFWDFCRVNSLRTLPYLREWHRKYSDERLRVIGVHTGGFPPSRDENQIRAATERLGIEYPVVIDAELEIWNLYGNKGWPARYLWTEHGSLFSLHYGEGAYQETEEEIQELLGIEQELVAPVRPEDETEAILIGQTPDCLGAYSGPYEAGAVWGVFEGKGDVRVDGRSIPITTPGCYQLIEHSQNTKGQLEIETSPGVTCHATCFTPGLADEHAYSEMVSERLERSPLVAE